MAHGAEPARAVLAGRDEAWLPGRRLAYALEIDPARAPQGRLALPSVHRLEDGEPEEEPRRPHLHPRERHLGQVVHGASPEARRADRVLPLTRPRAVDADRRERAGLPEAGAALVAKHRRRLVGRQDAAAGDGCPRRGPGFRNGASRAGQRPGGVWAEAEQARERPVLVRQEQEGRQYRATTEAL